MGYKLKHTCPFISVGGSSCHHRYGERDKKDQTKTICRYHNNQLQCPLFKLWREQLEAQLKNDSKKKNRSIGKKVPGL